MSIKTVWFPKAVTGAADVTNSKPLTRSTLYKIMYNIMYNVSPRLDQVCLSSSNNKHSVCTVCFSPSLIQKCTQQPFNLQTAHILSGTHHFFLCMLLILMPHVCLCLSLHVCVSSWPSLQLERLPVSLHVFLRVDSESDWGLVKYALLHCVYCLMYA